MTGIEIGVTSVILIVVLIYLGMYIPVALGLVSFIGVWIIRSNVDMAVALLSEAIADAVTEFVFATVPLFALMGLIVSKAGLGKDVYEVANFVFYRIRGGLGIATVAANAIFASITGSSIASASVFTRVAVPEMKRFGFKSRFTVGVVAGSSVLGMLIPPSAMLIIYSIVTEQSVGQMFVAGIIPGILGGFGMMGLSYWFARRHNYPVEEVFRLSRLWVTFKEALLAFTLPVIILGGIF
ncbi:MAG: TRAP transporter large permease subunit, partial [Rhodospirillaceae bacterium]|nr:TRAP transporter large permease subunit [Rhodospirillaceae bacterium]